MGRIQVNAPCPCGTGRKYKACCGPWHAGAPAPDAEKLMRSRYCAYAIGCVDYIIRTTHPQCPEYEADVHLWLQRLQGYCRHTRFDGLRVLAHAPNGDTATVTFCVSVTHAGRDASFCEKSAFVRTEAGWLYLSGEATASLPCH